MRDTGALSLTISGSQGMILSPDGLSASTDTPCLTGEFFKLGYGIAVVVNFKYGLAKSCLFSGELSSKNWAMAADVAVRLMRLIGLGEVVCLSSENVWTSCTSTRADSPKVD